MRSSIPSRTHFKDQGPPAPRHFLFHRAIVPLESVGSPLEHSARIPEGNPKRLSPPKPREPRVPGNRGFASRRSVAEVFFQGRVDEQGFFKPSRWIGGRIL